MGLPKIDLPIFETKLISTGRKKIKYRPFTVREEKILLIAQESNDIEQVMIAIKQIINNCCKDVNVDKLPMFDMEYLLMQIRGKSVNNVIEFRITDPDTEKPVDLEVDIDEISITKSKGHKREIPITDDAYIIMGYPKLSEVATMMNPEQDDAENVYDVMLACVESVVEGDTTYDLEDFSKEEVNEFIESFTTQTVEDIKKFFDTMPVLKCEKEYVNANGDKKKIVLEGVETFFI
ncbi:gp26 family baseplate hub assembly chaperone [bacterium]|nr:gp26 family baseplate hub assembly chaperone [bacterium]